MKLWWRHILGEGFCGGGFWGERLGLGMFGGWRCAFLSDLNFQNTSWDLKLIKTHRKQDED